MKLEFLKSYAWRDEVKQLSKYFQIAFLASICERLIPLYSVFAIESGWKDADFALVRNCLDEAWLCAENKEFNKLKVNQLLFSYEQIIPDGSSITHKYVFEAEYAALTVCELLKFCLTSDEEFIRAIGAGTHHLIYNYLNWEIDRFLDDKFDEDEEKVLGKTRNEIVFNHPFTIREMVKENKDLQRLKGMPEITTEFIRWFRNLSQEQSKCVIDLD